MPWTPHNPAMWPARVAKVKRDIAARRFLGWDNGEAKEQSYTITSGTRVKIVMASRFGDLGITDDLDAEHGYVARVAVDDLELEGCA